MTEWVEMLAERIPNWNRHRDNGIAAYSVYFVEKLVRVGTHCLAPGCISGSLVIKTESYITMTPTRLICGSHLTSPSQTGNFSPQIQGRVSVP